jgi:UDP-N-acetylglucosamine diphosphorylase/glucosamine-1-phosphate N-acetyltransferase
MLNYILFEDDTRRNLLPLTFTRPVSHIRVGVMTIREKWEKYLNTVVSDQTEAHLSVKYPVVLAADNVFINGSVCPDAELLQAIQSLHTGQALVKGAKTLAVRCASAQWGDQSVTFLPYNQEILDINALPDIFSKNAEALKRDFEILTKGRISQAISPTNTVVAPEQIFIEEGATVECAILNASTGPIYIAKDAEVMEGCMIRGPFALGEHSQLKMGAKIYGATTFGPHCKIGGEVNNSVIFGFSNKAHDGFLGNSVIGEWCNLGADTNNSNLKNNYAEVKLWNYATNNFKRTGLQFCGLVMGDHSKCGINTMFNTGTVVGVSCNIFGSGFPRNFVPDFSWGGAQGFELFATAKAYEVAAKVFERRGLVFDETEKAILNHVYELTETYRKY